jgi:hypothetical protein
MSRFSPHGPCHVGPVARDALGPSVGSYLQSRRQKQLDDRAKEQDDLSLYQQGLREQTPEERTAVPGAGAVNQHLAAALNPNAGMPAPAEPTGYRPEDMAVHLGERSFVPTEAAKAKTVTDQKNRMLAEALRQSEIDKNKAQTVKDLREPVDRPVQQGHVIDPVTGDVKFFDPTKPPPNLRVNPTPRPAAEVGGKQKFDADQKNKIIDDFRSDTKKFEDVRSGWEVLNGALKQPSLATPFALADAYARISNPGAVVRPTTMQMIEELGSIDQRFRKFADHNINGQLPADITRDLVRTIGSMVKEHASTYDHQRHTFEYTDPFAPTPPVGGRAPLPAKAGASSGNVDFRDNRKSVTVNGKTFVVPE